MHLCVCVIVNVIEKVIDQYLKKYNWSFLECDNAVPFKCFYINSLNNAISIFYSLKTFSHFRIVYYEITHSF